MMPNPNNTGSWPISNPQHQQQWMHSGQVIGWGTGTAAVPYPFMNQPAQQFISGPPVWNSNQWQQWNVPNPGYAECVAIIFFSQFYLLFHLKAVGVMCLILQPMPCSHSNNILPPCPLRNFRLCPCLLHIRKSRNSCTRRWLKKKSSLLSNLQNGRVNSRHGKRRIRIIPTR